MLLNTKRPHILKLRIADVRYGMDTLLMHTQGSISPDIRPLKRTRASGVARTCQYIAYSGEIPRLKKEEYWEWAERYYKEINTYPWIDEIERGNMIVIDQAGINAGLMEFG
jgi:hypothetical protein